MHYHIFYKGYLKYSIEISFYLQKKKKEIFIPENEVQKKIGRVLVLSDCAHSFGAVRDGKKAGAHADFSVFSFHAVKNLTTAEGGAITWTSHEGIDDDCNHF